MERVPIELETFHHIYNRGVDKRQVFMNTADYSRFVVYLDVLNNKKLHNPSQLEQRGLLENYEVIDRLVDVVAFCLLPNHFHLLLYEITEKGIAKFMQRLGTAYTVYFNEKYERTGSLFQGTFKSKLINDDEYLQRIINYIHLNPTDLFAGKGKKDAKSLMQNIEEYSWSSCAHYLGISKMKFVNNSSLEDYAEIQTPQNYRNELTDLIFDSDSLEEYVGRNGFKE